LQAAPQNDETLDANRGDARIAIEAAPALLGGAPMVSNVTRTITAPSGFVLWRCADGNYCDP